MIIYSRRMESASSACNKNLDVFDFKEETEVSDIGLRISSAIDKYMFLATATSGKTIPAEEISYVPSLDINAISITHVATTLIEERSRRMADYNDALIVDEHPPKSSPKLRSDLSESDSEVNGLAGTEINVGATSTSPDNVKLPSDETDEMDPDENGSMGERSSYSSDVSLTLEEEDDGAGPSSDDRGIDEQELGSEDATKVTLYPEHMVYRDTLYTDSVIHFTSSFIQMKASTVDGDGVDQTFKFKWGIGDILQLSYQLYEGLEMVTVKIRLLSILAEKAECTSATELKFAVVGSSWYDKLEAIISLNVEYKALWSGILESEDTAVGHTGVSFSKYLPNFDRPFEEVVYPKGDPDAVSISKRDFDLLQPDTFVNDTIIDFYIKYLKNKIKPEERNRFHFFNSFFFRKLADLDKDPLNASEGAVAYQRVKKWTRKVNLFQKDYVFVPVNYNYHWSLIVMCHVGEVATYEDEDATASIKLPCVLHMDSFRGSHAGLKGLVQSYLREEWKGRQLAAASEDISSKFDNLRFIYLELPQQQNLFDCGLFLLHYVELFLEEAPLHFNPFKITKSTNFLNVNWFPPAEASLKRVVIQKLIGDLLLDQETSSEKECHLTTNVRKGSYVNLSPQSCHAGDQGIPSSSSSCIQCADVASNPCHGSESFTGIHLSNCNHTITFNEDNKVSLTPIEEDVEEGEQFEFVYTSQTEYGNGIISFPPYPSQDFISREPHESGLEPSPESSIFASQEPDSERDDEQVVEYAEMVDGNNDDNPTSSSMGKNTIPDTHASENSSLGLESDVQRPAKKTRSMKYGDKLCE